MTGHRLPERDAPAVALPRAEDVDRLEPEALIAFATEAAALLERARARLARVGAPASTTASADEYLTAEDVAALLRADVAWVYRHQRPLGGIKLDGLLRFSGRRLDAYVARQARRGA